ncbi:MAG: radical SAM protein [Magnetococcales bacterium]|nr:radical SAM protein [Magnetococcales bacterium]MBF0150438.1 radical SAM protein [Magnetococcales bacterium]MBF0172771.1 radical SAM protein [Magnetococcales bacterium]MBF0630038.1 radical SAM protein [Magnetococcales bacterium]
MNILLMTCRANSEAEDRELPGQMPLGLGYIAACVERHTPHSVTILDIPHVDASLELIAERIEKQQVRIVGFTTYVSSYLFLAHTTRELKKRFPHLLIVAGGPLASTLPEILLEWGSVDVVVQGPGELAFLQIVQNLEHNIPNPSLVTGSLPVTIDDLPAPNWQSLGWSTYRYLPPWHGFPIVTSRGCPYKCNYCTKVTGNIYHRRSVPQIIEEIKRAVVAFDLKSFMVQDELLFASVKHLKKFCDALIQSGLEVTWSAASRIDLLDTASIELLKKSGCRAIGVGIESGSQQMLDRMNKNLSLEKSAKNLRHLRQLDIKIMPYVIVGYPGETLETLQETEAFLIDNNIYSAMTYAFPFPGTVLWNIAIERNMISSPVEYLSRQRFSVSSMHYNFTNLADAQFLDAVEGMKKRVLRNYIHSMITKELDWLHTEWQSFGIHIFGAGYLGKGLHDLLREDPRLKPRVKSFLDEDPHRIGGMHGDVPVVALNQAMISDQDVYFIANNYYADLMRSKLHDKNPHAHVVSLG